MSGVSRSELRGLARLRNAFLLAAAGALLSLALPPPMGGGLASALMALVALLAIGLPYLGVLIASWILRVMGWADMCRARIKRFYCAAKYAVLLGPLVAASLLAAGVLALLRASAGSELVSRLPEAADLLLPYGTGGVLAMAVADVVEGVALLDLGLIGGVKTLAVGAATYLAALGVWAAPSAQRWLATASDVGSLIAYVLLVHGLHSASRRVVEHEVKGEDSSPA